jgi:hypothetical protein
LVSTGRTPARRSGSVEHSNGVARAAHDRLLKAVERCVDQHRIPGRVPERFEARGAELGRPIRFDGLHTTRGRRAGSTC